VWIFSEEVWIFSEEAKDFSRVGQNLEIFIFPLVARKVMFFTNNLIRKCQISKSRQGHNTPALPTPVPVSILRTATLFASFRRRSLPGDICLVDNTTADFQKELEEFLLERNAEHPWLCMALYRALLQLGTSDLCSKALQHLQTISPHLSSEARQALTSLVLVPVLLAFADVAWEALKPGQQVLKETYSEVVVTALIEILLRFLERSDDCRAITIRHGGLKAINQLLYLKTNPDQDQTSLHDLMLQAAEILTTSPTPFSPQAVVHVFSPAPMDVIGRKARGANQGAGDGGAVRTLLQGFSFSWSSDKNRGHPVLRDRSTSFTGRFNLPTNPASNGEQKGDEPFRCNRIYVDEMFVHQVEAKRFVQNSITITGATYCEKIREKFNFASRLTTKSHAGDSADTADPETGHRAGRRLSETSGYRSTSPDSAERVNSHDLRSLHSLTSSSSFATESVTLPDDDHAAHWENIAEMWNIVGLAVPLGGDLCRAFVELGGFDVTMKLMHLITTSLSFHFESSLDFTSNTVDVTFTEQPTSSNVDVTNENKQPHGGTTIDEQVASDDSLTADDNDSLELPDVVDDPDVTGAAGDAVVEDGAPNDEGILKMKLTLLTACLRICLFCAHHHDQVNQ